MNAVVRFRDWECVVEVGIYRYNDRISLVLVDKKSTGAVAIATTNVIDIHLEDDEVCIKDYSENEGILGALLSAGVVLVPHRFVPSGFVIIPVCRLNLDKYVYEHNQFVRLKDVE